MEILITGATGYIGGAVAEAVQAAGHGVHALAHSGEERARVRERGWEAVAGDLREGAALERVAGAYDAVIHAANTGGAGAGEVDAAATRALLRGLGGSGKPLVYTSGAWVLGAGASHEGSPPDPPALVAWRGALEGEVLAAAPGVRSVVLRPGIVYGRGGGIPGMVARGELPVVGTGAQRWPLVHVEALARLYVRALGAPAGSVLHGVSATAIMREIALLGVAAGLCAGVRAQSLEEARAGLGAFADALALDQLVSSRRTREALGWEPCAPSPVEEFLAGSYAAAAVIA